MPEQNQPRKIVDLQLLDRFIRLCTVCLACLMLYSTIIIFLNNNNNNNRPPAWISWSHQEGIIIGGFNTERRD